MVYSNPRSRAEKPLQFQAFDAAYVENLCAGNPRIQEHFIAYFTELLRIKLRSRLQSSHAIDDVCQETFARVFSVLRKDGGLRQPERLGAFVNTVCNHVLLEQYRASSRNEELPELPATGVDALEIVAARQIREKIREILSDLPARDRNLLKAVFLDERDRDDICSELGVDREYLRVLLHRAKQEFKVEYVKRLGRLAPIGVES
jgi:RNA polymerase sigma-70 factor (ECF subfamily)